MNTMTLVLSIVAIVLSIIALIIGCAALAFVIGLKNSTHQVVWKEAEVPKSDDPFQMDDEEFENESIEEIANPNKRQKPFEKFENAELVKTGEELHDLDDPGVSSNFA
jgi:hypothetical protein